MRRPERDAAGRRRRVLENRHVNRTAVPAAARARPGTYAVDVQALRERVEQTLRSNWVEAGYTAPHSGRYRWQWLWDSCFHAILWAELGDDRGVVELCRLFDAQDSDGFVPHIIYTPGDEPHRGFWGRRATSSITQPPMYGHALAELHRRGVDLPEALVASATRALRYLLVRRRRLPSGLITLCHPWEAGTDNSPRWDHWFAGAFAEDDGFRVKGELMTTIERSPSGAPLANARFGAAGASFNALTAFNCLELASVTGDGALTAAAVDLAEALDERWDDDLRTWCDAGPSGDTSGRVRTTDALTVALVATPDRVRSVVTDVLDDEAYGARFGPTGVHRLEPSFEPAIYWRGSSWPPVTYLLWTAARRGGVFDGADRLAAIAWRGAVASDLAEHLDPDLGCPLGSVPQSWSGLPIVMDPNRSDDSITELDDEAAS